MVESRLSYLVEPLREMLYQWHSIIEGYKEKNSIEVVGLLCDMLPIEILASFKVVPLKIPAFILKVLQDRKYKYLEVIDNNIRICDYIIVSDKCCCKKFFENIGLDNVVEFKNMDGFGEEACISLNESLDEILKKMNLQGIKNINHYELGKITDIYNQVRRTIRGICSIRKEKPGLLSNNDLGIIFEAAQCLPAEMVLQYLSNILDQLNSVKYENEQEYVNAMIYGEIIMDWNVLDEIEDAGCLLVEDDLCNGRRQFDLSHNVSSNYLYYEILYSFSFRPLCPSIRPSEERHELLYKLIKNHGIDLVIFLAEGFCENRFSQIENLRIKLMRQGIDPIVIKNNNNILALKDYLEKVQKIKKIQC